MELRIKRIFRLSILFLFLTLFSSCFVIRSVFWYPSGVTDYRHFPSDPVQTQSPHQTFKNPDKSFQLLLPAGQNSQENFRNLEDLLKSSHTKALLTIRNDTLLYSYYSDGTDSSSIFSSFSVAKSFVSALIGIALEDGVIKSLDQPVTDFFPELKDPGYRKVTLRHLLTMRSGIGFNEGYNDPFGDAARIYYGRNIERFTRKMKVISEPGLAYSYASGNAQLLAMILEKATGKSISSYLEEKIWKPLGMEYPASWSVDKRKNGSVKAFCCVNATAPDFAKFGQLYLDKGYRGEQQIVPPTWVSESLKIQNDSRDSRGYPYTYYWRVKTDGDFFAYGVLGQYIYVCPRKNVVVVRIGEKAGSVNWPEFLHQLMDQL
jgi:CubicO group peptidase (beta-lactamase class C family)